MKKVYEAPEAEVVLFEGQFAEVICDSTTDGSTTNTDATTGGSGSGTNE